MFRRLADMPTVNIFTANDAPVINDLDLKCLATFDIKGTTSISVWWWF